MRFHTLALSIVVGFVAVVVVPFPSLAAGEGEHHVEEHAEEEGMECPMVTKAKEAMIADVVADLNRTADKLISLAEAIPAESYGWSPADDVRTVSEVFMHVVGTNNLLPSAIGAAPPEDLELGGNPMELMQRWEREVTDKDEIVSRLRESFEYAGKAIRSLDPTTLDETIELFGPPSSRRSYVFVVMTHAHEHLGQSIAYARSLGVVPPWSAREESAEEGGSEDY